MVQDCTEYMGQEYFCMVRLVQKILLCCGLYLALAHRVSQQHDMTEAGV